MRVYTPVYTYHMHMYTRTIYTRAHVPYTHVHTYPIHTYTRTIYTRAHVPYTHVHTYHIHTYTRAYVPYTHDPAAGLRKPGISFLSMSQTSLTILSEPECVNACTITQTSLTTAIPNRLSISCNADAFFHPSPPSAPGGAPHHTSHHAPHHAPHHTPHHTPRNRCQP